LGLQNADNFTVVYIDKPKWSWAGRWWWYNKTLPRLARFYEADVLYSLSGILTASAMRRVGTVTTVNNMVPFSEGDGTKLPFWSRSRLRYSLLKRLYVRALRSADAVVLHSHHALELVTPHAGDISKKTFVALTGVPSDIRRSANANGQHPQEGRPYLLYFSAFYPYKNHLRVMEAYKQGLSLEPNLPDLVLAGMPVDAIYFQEVMKVLEGHNLGKRIRYVGALERAQIPTWISNAEINIFASTCETNPVTLAEILGLGSVLACSSSAPVPEIVGDAGEYFDPKSVDSIAQAIVRVFRDPARQTALRERARNRAKQLSWDECGVQMWRAATTAYAGYRERSS
jgi:glycosyltransferase involved in cell wall biosynthesis